MTILAEAVLQRVIAGGIRAVRRDPRIIDNLFKNLTQIQLAQVKSFLLKRTIEFSINYPKKTELKVPAIVLLLKNESESQAFLGDHMGAFPHYEVPDTDLSADLLGGNAASISGMSGLPRLVLGELNVVTATESSITSFDEASQASLDALVGETFGCLKLYVTSGAGAGGVYTIKRITSYSLDIEGSFDPQLDSTSVVDIRESYDPELALGEPSRIYDAKAINLQRKGANFEAQYYLEVIAGHQDEVLYLYSLLKAILYSNRALLEAQGIQALKVSGTDFAPRQEYLPSEVFQRIMTLQFTYPMDFLEEIEVIENIDVVLAPRGSAAENIGDEIILATITI